MASLADGLALLMDDESGAVASGRFPHVQEAWTHLDQHIRDGGFPEEIRAAAGEVHRPFEALEGDGRPSWALRPCSNPLRCRALTQLCDAKTEPTDLHRPSILHHTKKP